MFTLKKAPHRCKSGLSGSQSVRLMLGGKFFVAGRNFEPASFLTTTAHLPTALPFPLKAWLLNQLPIETEVDWLIGQPTQPYGLTSYFVYLLPVTRHVRLPIPNTSRTLLQGVAPSRHSKSSSFDSTTSKSVVTTVFKAHIENANSSYVEIKKLVDWIHTLNSSIGLELSGVYQSRSTELINHVPWTICVLLNGLSGFGLICETFGRNKLPGIISHRRHRERLIKSRVTYARQLKLARKK